VIALLLTYGPAVGLLTLALAAARYDDARVPATPRLCRVCAYRLDPVVAEDGVHPLCDIAPQDVPQWRRDIAAVNARRGRRNGGQR
jgi:hypothetical protein